VTVTAAERLGVDAAILFADILLILEPLGFALEYAKDEGPVIHNPVRKAADVDRLRRLEGPEPLGYVMDAVRSIRAALRPATPLIGFAGAPFTLACYAIEGSGSRHYELWHARACRLDLAELPSARAAAELPAVGCMEWPGPAVEVLAAARPPSAALVAMAPRGGSSRRSARGWSP
jgi:hypothetical protein